MYPSIEVPKDAKLTINNNTAKSLSLYASGVDGIPVTSSVIGTYGIYSTEKVVVGEDVGVIVINGGTVNVNPKKVYLNEKLAAVKDKAKALEFESLKLIVGFHKNSEQLEIVEEENN